MNTSMYDMNLHLILFENISLFIGRKIYALYIICFFSILFFFLINHNILKLVE